MVLCKCRKFWVSFDPLKKKTAQQYQLSAIRPSGMHKGYQELSNGMFGPETDNLAPPQNKTVIRQQIRKQKA
jgi:hypothetical protein